MTDKQEVQEGTETPEVTFTTEEVVSKLRQDSKDETRTRLEAQMNEGCVSPIILARALNIVPQMIYNYIRADRIKARHNNSQKLVIDIEEAVRFASTQYVRRELKARKVQAELAGK